MRNAGSKTSFKWVAVATLAATLVAVGCDKGGSAVPADGATATTAPNKGAAAGPVVTITGAGSTFVNPAMSKWAYAYHEANPNITVNYQSVGSGAGIAQYKEGTVDFGATDAPVSDADLAKMPTPTVHIPVVAGAEVLAYNVPGVQNDLKLTGDEIAGIFLGKIKNWNDPQLAKDNAGIKLPDLPINVCHRSDGSGTTFIFTDYLSSVSSEWAKGPGKGKTVNWPVGVGGKGSDGVAGLVKGTPGAIGYVELAYAVQAKLTFGQIKNAAGNFVTASPDSTAAAANAALDSMKKDVRVSLVNSSGKDSYPICGFTYVLVSKAPKDAAKGKALVDFLKWTMGPGQKMITDLQYAPFPQAIVDLNTTALDQVQGAK